MFEEIRWEILKWKLTQLISGLENGKLEIYI